MVHVAGTVLTHRTRRNAGDGVPYDSIGGNIVSRSEKAVFTNLCMISDGKGNILVQDRRNPDWPGVTFPGAQEALLKAEVELS